MSVRNSVDISTGPFVNANRRLLAHIRTRIRNGEFSERSLGRAVGISQPHIHNVLKGHRILSASLADSIIDHLGISLLDLYDEAELAAHLEARSRAGRFNLQA